MSSIVYFIAALATLVALLLWVRQRGTAMRLQSAEREQRALEMELSARIKVKPVNAVPVDAAPAVRDVPPSPGIAADPLAHAPERAAAGLDPIEELISRIVADPEPPKKVAKALTARVKRRLIPLSMRAPSEADAIGTGVPLRELALAWYESRGYRGTAASPAVWPIELVLRHCDDAARAYAFVVQNDHVTTERVTALVEQAREIGLMRVAIVAEAGYEREAKMGARKRHVRLIDRRTMELELLALELPTSAKIIAVARKRAAEAVPAAA